MELYGHNRVRNQSNLKHQEGVIRKEVASKKEVEKTPGHGGNEKYQKECSLFSPRPCGKGSKQ